MKLKNKNVLVYGLGASGLAVIDFLKTKNSNVYYYDDKNYMQIENCFWLNGDDVSFIDFVVISPGIGDTKLLNKLNLFKIPVYSELKFASMFVKGKIIAVTGTNGKTTVVNMLYDIFKSGNKDCILCGNVGTPLIKFVNEKHKYFICEVSSFQLENLGEFKTYISVLLNVQPDHLDRHKTLKNYRDIKFSIFENIKNGGLGVINENLKNISFIKAPNVKKIYFSGYDKSNANFENGNLIYKKYKISVDEIKLQGRKNWENILACLVVCDKCKINKKVVENAVKSFVGLKHRLEFVAEIDGVKYINDSKATNPASTCLALECFENVVLLLGGQDKKLRYDDIFKYKNIKYVVAFGQAKDSIYENAKKCGFDEVCKCNTLSDAISYAKQIACYEDVVLLSPACSSYDQFKNYQQRGEEFINIVKG